MDTECAIWALGLQSWFRCGLKWIGGCFIERVSLGGFSRLVRDGGAPEGVLPSRPGVCRGRGMPGAADDE